MKRMLWNLNRDWMYLPKDRPEAAKPDCPETDFRLVSIPHTNAELPYHNFREDEYAFVSWYRRRVDLPSEAKGRRVILRFDGVMIAATVYVNGRAVAPEHRGGYVPFAYDITDHVQFGESNLIAVRVDSTERADIPPFGFVVDYMTFGGVYRDVRLQIVDPLHIETFFARPRDVLTPRKALDVTVRLANAGVTPADTTLRAVLRDDNGRTWQAKPCSAKVPPGKEFDAEIRFEDMEGISLWDLDSPNLYTLTVELDGGDSLATRVGFRTAEFRDDGAFYLNDRAVKLRGLNRHQTFPYVGAAAPARMQRRDADILKSELACNVVRTSHYPQSPYFLDRCDEIGLLVFEEIPGWQHIGDETWRQVVMQDVEAMIVRDRNHPSVILWGVRINESRDCDELYTQTNVLAHRLDPTRQTGGVRCFFGSNLLEDVYTMNDFHRKLREPTHPRYLNTEFCGHMFSTKTFDQENRAVEHALWHTDVINAAGGQKTAGTIGWCAFDYNTHAMFGSGDRICYHGVMDMFRYPKLAAHLYASQHAPKQRVVLEPATYWTAGDRSGGGVDPLVVFSNVEEIEVLVGRKSLGRFRPDRETYPNMPHPPFRVTGTRVEWGQDQPDLTVVGFIGGREVARKTMSCDGIPSRLEIGVDDASLQADGADMTRLWLRITEEHGNVLPYAMQPVSLEIEGPAVLVGDNPHPMPGGRGAVFVRAGRQSGLVRVTARTLRLEPQTVEIEIVKS